MQIRFLLLTPIRFSLVLLLLLSILASCKDDENPLTDRERLRLTDHVQLTIDEDTLSHFIAEYDQDGRLLVTKLNLYNQNTFEIFRSSIDSFFYDNTGRLTLQSNADFLAPERPCQNPYRGLCPRVRSFKVVEEYNTNNLITKTSRFVDTRYFGGNIEDDIISTYGYDEDGKVKADTNFSIVDQNQIGLTNRRTFDEFGNATTIITYLAGINRTDSASYTFNYDLFSPYSAVSWPSYMHENENLIINPFVSEEEYETNPQGLVTKSPAQNIFTYKPF